MAGLRLLLPCLDIFQEIRMKNFLGFVAAFALIAAMSLVFGEQATATRSSEHAHHERMEMMMGSGAMQAMMDDCMALMKK